MNNCHRFADIGSVFYSVVLRRDTRLKLFFRLYFAI